MKFDVPFKSLDTFKPPTNGGVSFLLIGSTRSGKSTAMCWVWERFFKAKHLTILMTLSTQADIYRPLGKSALIASGFYPELIREPMKLNRETKNSQPFCLIFDDLAADGKSATDMTKLLTIGRNAGMSCILAGQRMTMLNATGRANCNVVCLFKQNTDSSIVDTIKCYLRSYLPAEWTMNEMVKWYKSITQDHQFIVVNTLEDEVFLSKV